MSELVLSLFPGIGMLDTGFEGEGFCVVRGPDVLWGGDIRIFHPPTGRFEGIIGGDPCQSHSALANLIRAKGLEPRFPDMTPEFQRVIEEACPAWFLRENTPQAPEIKPAGYDVRSFLLDHSHLDSGDGTGHEQMRRRRFWFGVRDGECPELRQWIDFALFVLPDAERATVPCGHGETPGQRDRIKRQAVAANSRAVPVKRSSSGKIKSTATGVPSRTLAEMLELQDFPPEWLDHQPWTMQAKRQMVGNGVPLPMARALAHAIRVALERAAA